MDKTRFRLIPVVFCGAALLGVSTALHAGEKIRFSEPTDQVEIPGRSANDRLLTNPLEFTDKPGGSSSAPLLMPPDAMPMMPRSFKEQKNWMFDESGKLDKDAALKQIFGIRDYGPDNWQKRPKSDFQTFMDTQNGETNGPSAFESRTTRGETNPASSFRSSQFENRDSLNPERPNPELDSRRLLNPTPSLDPVLKLPEDAFQSSMATFDPNPAAINAFNPNQNQDVKRTGERDPALTEFEKLIGPSPIIATSISDLINSSSDTTRQPMNPIVGRNPNDHSLSSRSSLSDPFGTAGAPSSSRFSTTLESFNSRHAPASLAPGFTPPPIAEPLVKPSGFQFQKRKF